MVVTSKCLPRKLLASGVLLYAVTLIKSNDLPDIQNLSQINETSLEVSNITASERQSRSPLILQKTATLSQDTKISKPQGRGDDLKVSGSEAKRAAKSPLALKLLKEQEELVSPAHHAPQVLPGPITYARPEQEAVYYHQTPQENAGGVPEYAETEEETPTHKAIGPTKPPRYQYVYKVKDPEGNDFGHSEARVGDRTWGRYFVQLPDGRQKTVRYWADDTGYHAEVQYKGQSVHTLGVEK